MATKRAGQFEMEEGRADVAADDGSAEIIGGRGSKSSDNWTGGRLFVTTLDVVNHILIVAVTVFILYYALQEYSIVNLHAALCTVGYVLLMSEAILVLAGDNLLVNFLSRRAKCHLHWILQVLGLVLTAWGVVLVYRVKTVHFVSIHAITGISSLVTMCLLALFGYPVLVAAKLRKVVRPVVIKFAHNFVGIGCFVVGMTSQIYAYKKNWIPYVTGGLEHVQLLCIVLTGLITVLSLRGALVSLYRQAVALAK